MASTPTTALEGSCRRWTTSLRLVYLVGSASTAPFSPSRRARFAHDARFIGALTAVLTNPIWVIKTRMLSTSSRHPGAYTSILDGTRQIFRSEGLHGFYRGLVPSLFGVSHGALQFMAYERMKRYRGIGESGVGEGRGSSDGPARKRELSNTDYLVLSALAKSFAGASTYPYQVVRARLQTYEAGATYKGVRDVVRQGWRREGPGGFYKGLGPNIVRVLPSTCVTFLVYENTRYYMPRLFAEHRSGK